MTRGSGDTERCTGRILNGYAKFIRKKWGENGLNGLKEATGIDLTDISNDRWYPDTDARKVLKWLSSNHGMDICRQAGYYTVAERGAVTYVARIAGLKRVLDSAQKDFQRTLDFGDMVIEHDSDDLYRVSFTGICFIEETCTAWQGVMEGILKITNTTGTVTKTSRQVKGDDTCTYELRIG